MCNTRKMKALLLALCTFVLWCPCAAALTDEPIENGISVQFEGEPGGPILEKAYAQRATYHIWDVENVAAAFWPQEEIQAVLSSHQREDDEDNYTLDGQSVYMDILDAHGASVRLSQPYGRLAYTTAQYDERVQAILEKDSFEHLSKEFDADIASEAEMQEMGTALHSALNLGGELVPLASRSIEMRADDLSYTYNCVDFAHLRDGLLCANREYSSSLSALEPAIPAESFSIYYDENGLCAVDIVALDVERVDEPQDILPYSAILAAMQKEYAMIISDEELVLQSAQLCYVATPVAGSQSQFDYVPTWRFGTSATVWSIAGEHNGNLYDYNALSGMPIY